VGHEVPLMEGGEKTERKVRRKGGELVLCRCPACGAWHVRARVPRLAGVKEG
jgi:uncharacterized Zn finger protein